MSASIHSTTLASNQENKKRRSTAQTHLFRFISYLVSKPDVRTPPTNPRHRRLEPQETLLLHRSRDLCANARIDHTLMHDNRAARLVNTLHDRLSIPWINSPEIDELDRAAKVAFGVRNGRRASVQRGAVADDGEVGAGLDDLGFAQGQLVGFDGDVFDGGAVEDLGFHEDYRVVAEYGG